MVHRLRCIPDGVSYPDEGRPQAGREHPVSQEARIREFRYWTDREGRIAGVDEAWDAFARLNDATHLLREQVVGQTLKSFINQPETWNLYQMMMDRARAEDREISVPFRCDAPDRRRYLSMRIRPRNEGGFDFHTTIVSEQPRAPQRLFEADRAAAGDADAVTVCSWCKRLKVEEAWLEVEAATERLGLFEAVRLPPLTHGICPDCLRDVRAADGLDRSATPELQRSRFHPALCAG